MNLLESLKNYVTAQKGVGTNFIILGLILLTLSAVIFFLVTKNPLANGLKWGLLITGLLIGIGGFSYQNFSNKIETEVTKVYQVDKMEFIQSEYKRMEKVDKGFLTYQIIFASFVLLSLIVILFVHKPFLKGIAFSIAILFIGIMLIESFSHKSITRYTNILRQEASRIHMKNKDINLLEKK